MVTTLIWGKVELFLKISYNNLITLLNNMSILLLGHKLEFILTPTPRWPDGMCTYDPVTQLLFTHKLFRYSIHCSESLFKFWSHCRYIFYSECSCAKSMNVVSGFLFFSSHVCSSNFLDLGGWDSYGEDWRYFYDCMLSPVPRQVSFTSEMNYYFL